MPKITDRFIGGVLAGLGANVVKQAIDWAFFSRGYSKECGAHKAAGFFLKARHTRTRFGTCLGIVADNSIAAGLGICAAYLFTFTGKDYALLKGLVFGNTTWDIAYGVLSQFGATSVRTSDVKTVLASWISHSVFGLTEAFLLTAICAPDLFEPKYHPTGKRVPGRNNLVKKVTEAIAP